MIAGCRGSSRLRGGDIGLGWQSAAGLFSLSLAALAAGCSGGSSGATPTANPAVTISGPSQARLGSTVQLSATVANTTNTAVTWQVNGAGAAAVRLGAVAGAGGQHDYKQRL